MASLVVAEVRLFDIRQGRRNVVTPSRADQPRR
jgi:hypothetical protein